MSERVMLVPAESRRDVQKPPLSLRRRVFFLGSLSLMVFSSYCFIRYALDNRWTAALAHQIVEQAGAQTRRQKVMAVRDYVRSHVDYKGAAHDSRPFLRATARETLESGKGYCGESTRAFINLAGQLGIRAHRVNLHGKIQHVVAEAEIAPGDFVVVDPQFNPVVKGYFDERDWHLDELVGPRDAIFNDYSNINLNRMPLVNHYVRRVRLVNSSVTWTMENPWLILSLFFAFVPCALLVAFTVDRVLLRFYAHRLGVSFPLLPCFLTAYWQRWTQHRDARGQSASED